VPNLFSGTINIGQALLQYICLLFSLCFHEAAHAMISNRCGDPSARLMGRMTLNPLAHIDPIGTVVLPLIMIITKVPFLFGWAKPVPFNPRNLNDMRRDPALIALAGPLSNFLLALLCAVILRVVVMAAGITSLDQLAASPLCQVALFMIMINLVLMVFNLIPVPPLDGHHVLYPFLPPVGQRAMEQIGPFGILIAIFLARPVLSTVFPVVFGVVLNVALLGTGIV